MGQDQVNLFMQMLRQGARFHLVNCSKVAEPKFLGGLSIKDLTTHSNA